MKSKSSNKVALIIIYNHRYDKNIDIIEKIYRKRFPNIYHLMPFYDGEKENVIPVYENSFYFQGYIAQGLKSFFSKNYSHYIFLADDLILNPEINEFNYRNYLSLCEKSSFLTNFIPLHCADNWARVKEAYDFKQEARGLEAQNELPTYNEAEKILKNFDLELKPLRYKQIFRFSKPKFKTNVKKFLINVFKYLFRYFFSKIQYKRKYLLQYPLVGGYSDFVVVSSENIKAFCHYCGVFAAMNLFVEVALPTALVLSAEKIITEKDINLKGQALWTEEDYKVLEKFQNNLKILLRSFPKKKLYLHPIKLSKWDTKSC